MFVNLFVSLFFLLFVRLFVFLLVSMSICLLKCWSLSIYLLVYIFICLCISLIVFVSTKPVSLFEDIFGLFIFVVCLCICLFAVFLDFFVFLRQKQDDGKALRTVEPFWVWISQQIIIRDTGVENLGVWTRNGL